jgi:hypothetical protein
LTFHAIDTVDAHLVICVAGQVVQFLSVVLFNDLIVLVDLPLENFVHDLCDLSMEGLRVHTQLCLGTSLLEAKVFPFGNRFSHLRFGYSCLGFYIVLSFATTLPQVLLKLSLSFEF